jgi:hypothetical protein
VLFTPEAVRCQTGMQLSPGADLCVRFRVYSNVKV